MDFEQYPITKVVEINGESVIVPLKARYVSVDWTKSVRSHTEKPSADDGWWLGGGDTQVVGEAKGWSFDLFELPISN